LKKKISDIKIREQAEIENINKNSKKKIKQIINIQLENFCKDLISIIDNLKNIQNNKNQIDTKNQNMIQGIPLILKSLLNITEKFGLKTTSKEGKLFNSVFHTAISNENLKNTNECRITEIIQDGYVLKEKVIRKAVVKISQNTRNNNTN